MNGSKRFTQGAAVLALSVACLSGCQHFNQPASSSSVAMNSLEGNPRLSSQQTADIQVALGRTLEQRGEWVPALAAYQDAVKRDPKRSDACLRLAILHDRQGKFKESAEWYRKALQASPGNADIYCDMGYSLYLQRRWAEAEMNLQQALALKPEHPRAHNNLGLVLAHTDRMDQALAHFCKGGSENDARMNLALALTLTRHWGEAREQYEAALAANPSSEAAQNGLRQVNALLALASGQPAGAPEAPTVAAKPPALSFQPMRSDALDETAGATKPRLDELPVASTDAQELAGTLHRVTPASIPDTPPPPAIRQTRLEAAPRGLSKAVTFFHIEPEMP